MRLPARSRAQTTLEKPYWLTINMGRSSMNGFGPRGIVPNHTDNLGPQGRSPGPCVSACV